MIDEVKVLAKKKLKSVPNECKSESEWLEDKCTLSIAKIVRLWKKLSKLQICVKGSFGGKAACLCIKLDIKWLKKSIVRKSMSFSPPQPHVEVSLSTSNDTVIKAVLIFAEGIFEVGSSIFWAQRISTECEYSNVHLLCAGWEPCRTPKDLFGHLHNPNHTAQGRDHQYKCSLMACPKWQCYILPKISLSINAFKLIV